MHRVTTEGVGYRDPHSRRELSSTSSPGASTHPGTSTHAPWGSQIQIPHSRSEMHTEVQDRTDLQKLPCHLHTRAMEHLYPHLYKKGTKEGAERKEGGREGGEINFFIWCSNGSLPRPGQIVWKSRSHRGLLKQGLVGVVPEGPGMFSE